MTPPTYIEDIEAAQFSSATACEGALIDNDTFKNWIIREPPAILLSPKERTETRLRLSYRRVMQLALTAELVRLGLQPRRAGVMAAGFTDVSHDERDIGQLYAEGITLLVAYPEEETSHVKNVGVKLRIADLFYSDTGGTRPGVVIVNVNDVDDRVRRALGLDRNWGRRKLAGPGRRR